MAPAAKHALTITGGDVVTPEGVITADVVVESGRILALRSSGRVSGRSLSATGCLVLPGGVDPHTHVHADVEHATISALHGGTTTVLTFPLPQDGELAIDALRRAREDVSRHAAVDVGIHASYLDPAATQSEELDAFAELGAFGLQVFLAFPELGLMSSDGHLYSILRSASERGLLVQAQCENGSVIAVRTEQLLEAGHTDVTAFPVSRPPETEDEAAHRVLRIAALAGEAVYLVHLSTARSMDVVRAARRAEQRVALELCTHHLVLDESLYEGPGGAAFVVGPPLRSRPDVEALWRAIADGTATTLASDHSQARYVPSVQRNDFTSLPMGLPGIELRLPLILSEGLRRGIPVARLASVLAAGPAEAFGLRQHKGAIEPGADADLVVWDPAPTWVVESEALHDGIGETPYAGLEVQGRIRYVVQRGRVAVADGELVGKPLGSLLQPNTPRRRKGGNETHELRSFEPGTTPGLRRLRTEAT